MIPHLVLNQVKNVVKLQSTFLFRSWINQVADFHVTETETVFNLGIFFWTHNTLVQFFDENACFVYLNGQSDSSCRRTSYPVPEKVQPYLEDEQGYWFCFKRWSKYAGNPNSGPTRRFPQTPLPSVSTGQIPEWTSGSAP